MVRRLQGPWWVGRSRAEAPTVFWRVDCALSKTTSDQFARFAGQSTPLHIMNFDTLSIAQQFQNSTRSAYARGE